MSTVNVGRQRELAEAESFLDGVHENGRGLLLEGEAGIGKSELWRAATRAARASTTPSPSR